MTLQGLLLPSVRYAEYESLFQDLSVNDTIIIRVAQVNSDFILS